MTGFMQSSSEIYFISAMMVLILIGCAIAIVAFFRAYKNEQKEREKEAKKIASLEESEEK
ncbi:MAG: hypothetical protein NZM17_03720 [Pyrinomonadaceae bacterium]|nr:hypothetical protein [Pyrinomonadaceae bacterium]